MECSNQPDTTQRSIIEEARKQLEGIQTDLLIIRVPVMQPRLDVGVQLEPFFWEKGSYVVTFRKEGGDWKAIEVE